MKTPAPKADLLLDSNPNQDINQPVSTPGLSVFKYVPTSSNDLPKEASSRNLASVIFSFRCLYPQRKFISFFSTYPPRVVLWVVAEDGLEDHELRAAPLEQRDLVLLAHVDERRDLHGHPDDALDRQVHQRHQAYQVVGVRKRGLEEGK